MINTNLGSVIAVNGNNLCYYSLEITENFCYYPPPHRIWSAANNFAFAIRAKLGLIPQMDVGPYAYDQTTLDFNSHLEGITFASTYTKSVKEL